ncbi:hypothetical protein [[Mycobacterium] zoologicum]|uniref:hypothetical protein n=1 Tax=[Mycobacterium] zoologicum TaxID=2872311 RepID=UPI002CB4334D|nr:hypothetical protein [Mycolicibacter sp. MYC101]MEB3065515.1 hypothetical protein [Mycolicibacter sp. MYC101]
MTEQSCIDIIAAFAREQATLPAPSAYAEPEWQNYWAHARFNCARIWLLLPVLWRIRCGEADAGWRDEVRAVAQAVAPTSLEVTTAAMAVADLPPQPWDPADHGPHTTYQAAADTWYQACSALLLDAIFNVQDAIAQGRVDLANRWYTETLPLACRQAATVLEESWRNARNMGAGPAAAGFSHANGRLIDAVLPRYWLAPYKRSRPPDVAAIKALREQFLRDAPPKPQAPVQSPGIDPQITAAIEVSMNRMAAVEEARRRLNR